MTAAGQRRILSITRSGLAGTVLVLVVAAVCVRLGFWQLDRREQRSRRNAGVEERAHLEPLPLTETESDTAGLTYRRVRVSGPYDHDRSIVLPGRSLRGVPGVHLLTPVRLDDGGSVLVNRGWLPSPDGASVDLEQWSEPSAVTAEGIILPLPRGTDRARTEPRGAPTDFQRVWFRIDADALRAQFPYRLAEFQVQLLPEPGTEATAPTRLELPLLDAGPHLGYAIQWFSFAGIALIGWTVMVLRRGAGGRPAPAERHTS